MNNAKEEKFINICQRLNDIGIQTHDENGNPRYFNEVMIEIANFLRESRKEAESYTDYAIKRQYILETIFGQKYVNDLLM